MISTLMRNQLREVANIAIGICCMMGVAGYANATIVECKAPEDSYTVFLSEPMFPSTAFTDRGQLAEFLERLQFALDQGRDGQWVRSPATNVRFVVCSGRSPKLDGQEFEPAMVMRLYTKRVLLEIWGRLSAQQIAEGQGKLSAQINYLLLPMQYASDLKEDAPQALQRLQYEAATQLPGDFVQLIARPLDVDAFVAAALGFKLLREGQHELAYGNLCRASALLGQMSRRKMAPGTLENLAALHAFVRSSASRAITQATSNPGYSNTGLLRLQDSKRPCAEGQ